MIKNLQFLVLLLFTSSLYSQTDLAGTTWQLAPTAQALAVGPTQGDFSWWSNSAGDVTTRACLFDDKFVFGADGSFQNVQDGETWLEAWQGTDPEGCGTSLAPHDGSNAATWSFDEAAGTLTLSGVGAHLGLAKVHNGGELASPADAPASITYPVVFEGNTMTVDINFGGIGFWHFVFEQVTEAAPVSETSSLAGTWVIAPTAQALAVGPTMGDFSWWSNSAGDVTTRACFFDDKFVFNEDGSFQNVQDGETWLEAWQGMDPEGCGASLAPHDGSNPATWSFDEATSTITLTGVGAHLGLAKVHNGGELASPADAPASITYPAVIDGDNLTIDIDFGGIGFWHFALVRVTDTDGPAPEPEPVVEATVNVNFGVDMNGYTEPFTQVYVSGTLNDWSGDANPLSDEDGDGIWHATIPVEAGSYEYKFTIDNWAAQEEFEGGEECTITTGAFTNRLIAVDADTEVCFQWNTCSACGEGVTSGEGTGAGETEGLAGTWRIAPIAQALAVGPTMGDFSWWSNSAADVTTRACFFDDQYVFNEDGTFMNVQDGETWLEPWQGVDPEACGASVAPHDGSNPATWTFDEAASTITLNGVGAYLGLAKVHNGGELASPAEAVESITYPVVIDGNTMTIDIDFGGIGFWHFVLVRGDSEVVEPVSDPNVIFSVDLNGFNGDFTQAYVSGSFNGWSGDANPLSDEDGDGVWTTTVVIPEGTYEYKFTLDNFAIQEQFEEGASCTLTTGEFTNRLIVVDGDSEVCFNWNTCDVCGTPIAGGGDGGGGEVAPMGIEGVWQVAPMAQALAVGPTMGDFSWWSNAASDVQTRACFFDDQYVFNADGTFMNVQDGETWLEPWQGVDPEACGAAPAPHDGSNAATWTFDEAAGTVTLNGVGAYLGLAKVHNGGELASPAEAVESITYPVVIDGNTMTIDIDFGGIGFWHFVLERQAVTTSTRVEVAQEKLFDFYPNPANSQIQIQSDEQIDELRIHDITGKILVVRSQPSSNETIDISNLTNGLYIIQARVGNKISVEKLSIN